MVFATGCKSKLDKQIDDAKKQAATTGQPQQIVTTDGNGNTVTTVVQPPQPGQNGQVVTTTVTPKTAVAAQPAAQPAPDAGGQATGTSSQIAAAPAPNPAPAPTPVSTPAPAPVSAPAPKPEIHVSKGTTLPIRIDQRISVKDTPSGTRFTGEFVEPIRDDAGNTIIPKGAPVSGVVDTSHKRGHFKGASELQLRLTSLTLHGQRYPLETRDFTESKKGKGKRSAAMIGGGSGLGLLIGGLAGGGKGALIGGLAGAGAGTAGAGLTGNKDLVIPAETVVRFRLADELVIQP